MSEKIGGVKVKRFKKSYQDLERPKLLYMTYILTFPDGDVWIKQRPLAHDLRWEMQQTFKEHAKNSEWKNRVMALWRAHECWWKDNLNVEHLILIEEKKRMTKWGTSKEGLGQLQHGVKLELGGI